MLNVQTKASRYDNLNAWLLSSIMLFGFLFSVLFLIWFTSVFDFSRRAAGPILVVSDPGDSKPEGVADDVLEPGVEEFPEVEVPQLANALEAVTDAVSSVRASLEKRSGDALEMGAGRGYGSREGGEGGGGDGIPEYKRWIIHYEADDMRSYAKQLSFFDIDIGVMHQTRPDIWRVHDVGNSPSVIKTDRDREAKTLRFSHSKMKMKRWDQELCKRAGVDLSNTLQAQFYPEATRAKIRIVENAGLEGTGKLLNEVKNTILKVVPEGGGYKFVVLDILYR
ncbi:MAG: hypothetical protein ACI814_002517 [Mariniblastus sp.]|jgi:hypothetical protein